MASAGVRRYEPGAWSTLSVTGTNNTKEEHERICIRLYWKEFESAVCSTILAPRWNTAADICSNTHSKNLDNKSTPVPTGFASDHCVLHANQ